jgi:hypothetical protein
MALKMSLVSCIFNSQSVEDFVNFKENSIVCSNTKTLMMMTDLQHTMFKCVLQGIVVIVALLLLAIN